MAQLDFHGLGTFFTQLKKIFATKTNINELETKLIGNILDESNPNDDTINGAKKYAQENITDLEDRLSKEIVSESNEWIIADEEDNIIVKINEDGFATTNITVKDEITATKITATEKISAKKVTINGADIEEAFVSIKDELIGNSGDSADKDTIYGAKTHTDNKVSDLKNELSESIVSQSDSWTIADNETDGNIILTVDKNGLETTNITSQTLETTDITSDNITSDNITSGNIKAETTLTVANMNVKEAIEKNQQEIDNIKDGTTSAGKANQLAESIKLTLGKDMSGEVSFNGAEDITLNATSNIEINGDNEFIECEKIGNETATQYTVAHKKLNEGDAGTYTKVTVDEAGHITIGTNPTTLKEYGIIDTYTKDNVDNIIFDVKTTAATDATNKADAALTAANSYTDTVKNELSESITSESDSWTVADQNNNIIATIDEDGLKTTGVETNALIVDGKNIRATIHYEDDDDSRLTDTSSNYISGDTLTVKTLISDGKYSYTAYVYDGETWKAMDGNYNAKNIILDGKVNLSGNYTAVGNIKKDSNAAVKEFDWSGMSVQDLLETMLSQVLYPTKPTPKVSMTLTNSGSKEIGSTITPSFTVTYNPGTYSYGSTEDNTANTGTYAPPSNVTITLNDNRKLIGTMESDGSKDVTLTIKDDLITVEESTSYYGSSVSCVYGDGAIPLTNTGSNYPDSQVKSGTASNDNDTSKITSYRNGCFYGVVYETDFNADKITGSIIRHLSGKTGCNYVPSSTFTMEVPINTTAILIACPEDNPGPSYVLNNTVHAAMTELFGINNKVTTIPVGGADATSESNGKYPKNYNIWMYKPANAYTSSANLTITLG